MLRWNYADNEGRTESKEENEKDRDFVGKA